MKRIIVVLFLCLLLFITNVNASLPLSGKLIIIDVGHGGRDMGTSYNTLEEKELNLSISRNIEKYLILNGASVLLTREDDYDLSSPNSKLRKRNDFDNRIDFINKSKADLYLSIHINHLNDKSYSGAQIFYIDDNYKLAEILQSKLNAITYPRSIKKIKGLYMYDKLKIKGVLIECGFISNTKEREKLQNKEYQELLSKTIVDGIIDYYK